MAADNNSPIVEMPDDGSQLSPLSAVMLKRLFFNPTRFFSNAGRITKSPEVLIVAWIAGIAYSMGRVDSTIIKSEFGSATTSRESILQWLSEPWINYWTMMLTAGAISGVILWFIGGWWYRRRLIWSGAGNVKPLQARSVYVYQNLVQSAPIFITAIVQTSIYPNYLAAWNSDEYWSSIVLLFVLWSCVTSYIAVTTAFQVIKWKARIWFLALPLVLYIVALGLVGILYGYLPFSAT